MSEFEYASVVVSIVLALGIADILRFFGDTVRDHDARKSYWVHTLWLLLLIKIHMDFWWQMWGFRDLLAIGPGLIYLLIGPALLFVATRTLLPGSNSSEDLEEMFFARKNSFFVLLLLVTLWSLVSVPQSSNVASTAFAVIGIVLFSACVALDKRWLHVGVVLLVALVESIELSGALAAA